MSLVFRTLILLLILHLAWTQCDADSDIQVFLDSSNPYCTKYSGTECTCCGYSNDNLYLYGSECTVGTSSDARSGEFITKKCDPNCASGSCQNGVCQKCNILDSTKGIGYYLYTSPDTGMDSCVTQCEYFTGFFGQKVVDKQLCSECPSQCTTCGSSSGCRECSYGYSRWSDSEMADFSTKVNQSSIDCSTHEARTTMTDQDNGYYTQFYLTPTDQDCKNSGLCDGSIDNPYDDINLVFTNIIENMNIGKQSRLKIDILFLKDNDNLDHYWLEDSTLPNHYKRLFERTLVDATLSPAYCDDSTKCFGQDSDDKPIIFIKSNLISLFVTWKMSITNIIFDGSELIPSGTCYETNKNSRTKCCDNSYDLPIPADSETDAICNAGMAYGTLLHPFLNYDPVMDVWPTGPYSFINMQMIYDADSSELPELTIEGCQFNHFWYHRYARSLITLDNHASSLTIKSTTFNNFYFTNGLITNVHESIQRDTLFSSNVVSTFDCTSLNPDITECFSISIESSYFLNSLYGDFSFSNKANQLKPSASLATATLSRNEGIVLFLVSFGGGITLYDNYFQNLASSIFSTTPSGSASSTKCSTTTRTSLSNLLHSVDRLIQIELGHEKYKNVQSSSVINIRNLLKGITVYYNYFGNNLASTGTNLFIHNFKNTRDYPIIIDRNGFAGNLAQLFGSSFAIVNYARDYVTMKCEGIYVYNNVFQDNIQCPTAVGNAVIACIPESNSLSPIFSKDTMDTRVAEASSWVTYYPSVNQATTKTLDDHYNTITQLVFTAFVNNLAATLNDEYLVPHPIDGYNIDTTFVTVSWNTFTSNFASIAQVFVQGAFKAMLWSNTFQDNCFPFSILFPTSITSMSIFTKVCDKESGYFASSTVMLRLVNYASLKWNTYDNNKQVVTSTAGLTIGSAISIDRHLAGTNVGIYYETFKNHVGLDFASIRSLETYINSGTASTTLTALENGVSPPLITYNAWENFAGVSYYSDINSNDPVSTSNRKSVRQGQFRYPYTDISSGTYDGNIWNSGTTNVPVYTDAQAVFWYFKDEKRETLTFKLATYDNGHLFQNIDFYMYDSTFQYNQINDDRNFLKLITFTHFYLWNNIFQYNNLVSRSAASKNSLINIVFQDYYAPYSEVNDNVFEYNFGRLFLLDEIEAKTVNDVHFDRNTIRHHIAPYTTIATYEVAFWFVDSMIAENVTSNSSFIYFNQPWNNVTMTNTRITNLTSSYSGCLMIDSFRKSPGLTDFYCTNSHLIVPKVLQAPAGVFNAFSACITLQNQPDNYAISAENIICESPKISYEDPYQIQLGIVKAQCMFISYAVEVNINGFTCTGASYEMANIVDSYLSLGYILKVLYIWFGNGVFQDNQAYGPIRMTRSSIYFDTVNITNNVAQAIATFMYAQSKTYLSMTNVTFEHNRCDTCAGGLGIYQGNLIIQQSIFTNNSAKEAPIFNIKIGTMWIKECNFTRNKASERSSIMTSDSSGIKILSSIFQDNEAPMNTFSASDGFLWIWDSQFEDNAYGKSGVPYINSVGTDIQVYTTTFNAFRDYKSTQTGAFISSQNSNDMVYISSCSFNGGSAKYGGAIYINGFQSQAQLLDSNFTNNRGNYGGAVYMDGKSVYRYIFIQNCLFYDNVADFEGGAIWNTLSYITMTNTNFTTPKGETLHLGRGYYTLTNVNLQGNRGDSEGAVVNSTSAVAAGDVYEFNLTDSTVTGFNYDALNPIKSSSPLYFVGQWDDHYLKNVLFERNTGKLGGAIHAEQQLYVEVYNCTFLKNSAEMGGAIYFDESLTEDFWLYGNSTFQENKADIAGGAIQYVKKKLYGDVQEVNTFINNQAPYGNDIAGYGVSLSRVPFNASLFAEYLGTVGSEDRLLQASTENSGDDAYGYNYTSGDIMYPPMMFVLQDEYGAVVSAENSSRVIMEAEKVGNSAVSTLIENEPYYTAYKGYFIIYPLKAYVGPLSGVRLKAKLSGVTASAFGRPEEEFANFTQELATTVPTQQCVEGQRLAENDLCTACSNGEYTLLIGSRDPCVRCPTHGICGGRNVFGPAYNYWRMSPTDIQLNECSNDEACLGASLTIKEIREKSYCQPGGLYNESFCFTGWCRQGYQGNLCADCIDGWAIGNSLFGTCTPCSENPKYYGLTTLLVFLGSLYVIIMIRSALKRGDEYAKMVTLEPAKLYAKNKTQSSQSVYFVKVFKEEKENEKGEDKQINQIDSPDCKMNSMAANLEDIRFEDMESNKEINPGRNPNRCPDTVNAVDKTFLKSAQNGSDQKLYNKSEISELINHHDVHDNPSPVESKDVLLEKENPQIISEIHLRILTSYIQIIAIIGTFNLEWPQTQERYLDTQKALSSSAAEVFSFDCFLKQSFFAGMRLRSYASKLFLFVLSPVAFLAVIIVIWTLLYILKYRTKFRTVIAKLKTNIIMSFLVCLFILYPSILQVSVQAFWCKNLGDNENIKYLEADPQIQCWSHEHKVLAYAMSLPSLIIWGFGIPSVALALLFLRRKRLGEILIRRRYGFLYDGYKAKFYYWELVITYRKLAYIMISVFMSQINLPVKACFATGLTGISYLLQIRLNPYSYKSLNELEKRALIISTVTLYCAMFQLTKSLTSAMKVIVIMGLVIMNLYFFVYWIIGYLKAKSQEALRSKSRLARCCGGVFRFFAEFEWKKSKKKKTQKKLPPILEIPMVIAPLDSSRNRSVLSIPSGGSLPELPLDLNLSGLKNEDEQNELSFAPEEDNNRNERNEEEVFHLEDNEEGKEDKQYQILASTENGLTQNNLE